MKLKVLPEDFCLGFRSTDEQTFVSGKGVSQQSGTIDVYLYGQFPVLKISHGFGETWDSLNLVIEGNDAVTHIVIHPSEKGVYTVGIGEEHFFKSQMGEKIGFKLHNLGSR